MPGRCREKLCDTYWKVALLGKFQTIVLILGTSATYGHANFPYTDDFIFMINLGLTLYTDPPVQFHITKNDLCVKCKVVWSGRMSGWHDLGPLTTIDY